MSDLSQLATKAATEGPIPPSVLNPAIQSSKLGFPEILIVLLAGVALLVAVFAIGRKVFRVR